MESDQETVRAALARVGIVLPEPDMAFLAAQLPMLAAAIAAVARRG